MIELDPKPFNSTIAGDSAGIGCNTRHCQHFIHCIMKEAALIQVPPRKRALFENVERFG